MILSVSETYKARSKFGIFNMQTHKKLSGCRQTAGRLYSVVCISLFFSISEIVVGFYYADRKYCDRLCLFVCWLVG